MIEKCKALTANQNTEELPDLTRLFKNRARNVDVMQKCKRLLIAGYPPGRVALILRLPLERVLELYDNSYNPRCRRFARQNEHTNARLALTSFNEGAPLADIAAGLGLSLYWVVLSLRQNGVAESVINARMPPADDPLCVEYRKVCERKAASRFKPIQINPMRRVRKAAGQKASQTEDTGTTATA
ncbi:TPA: hypothetical protein JD053_16195 [Klebsiella michiganensis]|uniref:hypothetical protein n=1 Tax=Enterobacteriaceae TaxID=543 RepID=UPI0007CBC2E2|nr:MULTISPECIES: hypothetical protein [Enterobacteriaceae]DAI92728.1 MAG TPA: hypothetical protein [Caudoviricetes sp.]HDR2474979.1 hypothetical protein [Enterobacter soli]EKV5140113.1 hypothetical protein [Klebsiella michiganensis]EMB3265766.1 hypothetical protein [Klebsiella michiganensis]MBA4425315.1 hypothetical protein [Klebsiella michiganensis]